MGANAIGVELLVDRLEPALAFFEGVLGLQVVHRGPAAAAAGEIAVLDAGEMAIVLFEPVEDGPDAIPDATPRLTQLMFSLSPAELDEKRRQISEHGITTAATDERFFVPPDIAAGIVGFEMSVTFSPRADESDP